MYFIRYIHHILTDEQALCARQLAAILSHVKVLIAIIEGGDYPTSNLIDPYIGKMIDTLSEDKPTYTGYKGKRAKLRCEVVFIPLVVRNGCVLNHYLLTLSGRISPEDS